MSDNIKNPSLVLVGKELRTDASTKAIKFLVEKIGNHLRDPEIPFDILSVDMVNNEAYADVRLGPVVRVRLTGPEENPVVFFDGKKDETDADG